ncbi:MAG: BadF/BadG/BcrA/BcrD ATPase family protein [Chloroflexota bacterium]|nr:BadF/BadG/BcrA/BcrD ATPase family protein [Chloroflexota bacterium]
MTNYFLGIDIGATKTHALIADETGRALGFGVAGPGNYEAVDWGGYRAALQQATTEALSSAGITRQQVAGAGFGVAGYDWPVERLPTLEGIATLGLSCPFEAVNDTIIGLMAGSTLGWGVGLVAGTGNNCRGRDKSGREAHITGSGIPYGEFGGATGIVWKAIQAVSHAWSRRGPATQLTEAFVQRVGAKDATDLLEGMRFERYYISSGAAPLVFQIAEAGDAIARQIIAWSGRELAGSAIGIIRQLEFEELEFEVVLAGSIFKGGPLLLDSLKGSVREVAPRACFQRLEAPPVVGAVLLGMEQAGLDFAAVREILIENTNAFEE